MTFTSFADDLKQSMLADFSAVNDESNPVELGRPAYSDDQLTHVLVQYSVFSRKIVSFLTDAYYVMRFNDWDAISEELQQNIAEEFGESDEDGKERLPHYILLRRGFMTGLGVDLGDYAVSPSTQSFVDTLHAAMADSDPARVAGGVYALESSARPELVMTYEWTKELFDRKESVVPDGVKYFFLSHIDEIEVLHEGRLREACASLVESDQQQAAFEDGFKSVLKAMDSWWFGLHNEASTITN